MRASYDEIRRMSFRALDAGRAAAGIDEDSAHAVAWLEAVGLPGLATLADALDSSDAAGRAAGLELADSRSPVREIDARGASSVFFAASVIDLLIADALVASDGGSALIVHAAGHPLMLAAAAARFCPRHGTLTVTWHGVEFTSGAGECFLLENTADAPEWLDPSGFDVSLACTLTSEGRGGAPGTHLSSRLRRALEDGLEVDEDAHARIAAYAARILVPETEASRETGAGAGLTDND
jgi:hypothetical protein